jgi:hypothetical protein
VPLLLERIWVGADGTVKALYADNSLLLLASSGASFTHVAARDSARTVQLTECCLHRHRPAVAELLAFRNQHLDVPYVPSWLAQRWTATTAATPPPLFHAGYPITQVAWPPSACAALDQGLVELPGPQQAVLHSTCRSAQIVLERSGLRFAVSFPLLVGTSASSRSTPLGAGVAASQGAAGGACCYAYVQHTQVFSRKQCPARWQAALGVAVGAADLATACGVQPWRQLGSSCGTGSSPTHKPPAAAWQHQHVQQQWAPPGSPGSPARAMHDVAAQQQQQHDDDQEAGQGQQSGMLMLPVPSLTPAKLRPQQQQQQRRRASAHTATQQLLQRVTQLPIADELLQALPDWCQQQRQQQLEAGGGSSSSSTLGVSLAGALRAPPPPLRQQEQQPGSNGSSWWLEPSLMLPQDELLLMVWSRDATLIFLQVCGVSVCVVCVCVYVCARETRLPVCAMCATESLQLRDNILLLPAPHRIATQHNTGGRRGGGLAACRRVLLVHISARRVHHAPAGPWWWWCCCCCCAGRAWRG